MLAHLVDKDRRLATLNRAQLGQPGAAHLWALVLSTFVEWANRPAVRQGAAATEGGRCGAGAHAGAVEDVFEVFADGGNRDEQCGGDVAIAVALMDEAEHFPFARAELRDVVAASL